MVMNIVYKRIRLTRKDTKNSVHYKIGNSKNNS